MRSKNPWLVLGMAAFVGALCVRPDRGDADELRLTTGKALVGSILRESGGFWVLLSSRGIHAVAKDRVISVERSAPDGFAVAGFTAEEEAGAPDASATDPTASSRPTSRTGGGSEVVELVLSGTLAGRPLPSDHMEAFGRLGYFLQHESEPPFILVRASAAGDDGAAASSSQYRLLIEAHADRADPIDFYGLKLKSRYRCRLKCRLERRTGNGPRVLTSLSLVEDITGGDPEPSDDEREQMAEHAYAAALETLTQQLSAQSFFGGDEPDRRQPSKPAKAAPRNKR